ncbi:MAG: hypothetical protein KAI17_16770, partial [Thiotrichaceae bacterium]|nr:hypothetical protein [Thiotrichaceae bacterium]
MNKSPVIEVPAHTNILQFAADLIFEKFSERLPDLSGVVVLLPNTHASQQFNQALAEHLDSKTSAIIPPWSGTLRSWAKEFSNSEHIEYQIINEHARQLLFIEALQQHPDLFKEENKWQVTQALLKFFDELTFNQSDVFNSAVFSSAEQWQEKLQEAYGIEESNSQLQFEHLNHESKLVYTLWHAWQEQLSDNQLYDETGDYLSRLKCVSQKKLATDLSDREFICLGLTHYSKTELEFINKLIINKQCVVLEHEKTIGPDFNKENDKHIFAEFINKTYTPTPDNIDERAKKFSSEFSGELPFSVYMAKDEEQQVRAIDCAVRLSITKGNNRIAIISEDRKLSRRLRALLERANIQLHDNAGWSLATTQAATVIDRWLECIEEDFSAYPLLDCLKSPFIDISINETHFDSDFISDFISNYKSDYKKNIYRFEHDLIFHENVSSNITEYKKQLKRRLKRLTHWPQNSYKDLVEILDFLDTCAKPLKDLHTKNKNIKLTDFLDTLITSLETLGVIHCYQSDEAGLVLLETLESLKQSTRYADPQLNWQDCRIWLGMALESQNFTPPKNNSNIQLMTLEQASCLQFDLLIIASTETRHFPGSADISPFFNQSVRSSLELNTWKEQRAQRHELFNRTLLSAPEILLTACDEEKGEEKPVSPWLELLINFYELAYNKKPYDYYLQQLVNSNNEVFNSDSSPLPELTQQPSPPTPVDLVPERVSASSYQRLINCP